MEDCSHDMLEVNAIDLYRSLEISSYSLVCQIYVLHYILPFAIEKGQRQPAGVCFHFTKVTFILPF